MSDSLRFIEPSDVVSLVSSPDTKNDTAILDVRGTHEFSEGHIVGAVNNSSDLWQDPSYVDGIIQDNLDKKTVVFHCMLSQQRGPNCARIFSKRLGELNITDKPTPEVVVMSGGFNRFNSEYGSQSELVVSEDN